MSLLRKETKIKKSLSALGTPTGTKSKLNSLIKLKNIIHSWAYFVNTFFKSRSDFSCCVENAVRKYRTMPFTATSAAKNRPLRQKYGTENALTAQGRSRKIHDTKSRILPMHHHPQTAQDAFTSGAFLTCDPLRKRLITLSKTADRNCIMQRLPIFISCGLRYTISKSLMQLPIKPCGNEWSLFIASK